MNSPGGLQDLQVKDPPVGLGPEKGDNKNHMLIIFILKPLKKGFSVYLLMNSVQRDFRPPVFFIIRTCLEH